MFDCVLIANRGEIACRIMRSCRALGVKTAAVFSRVDRDALHVQMADVAHPLDGDMPAESYLRGDAIIAAARALGADAIHPGYGFLSENAAFAEAVAEAGLVFVGPSAVAIRQMGLKDRAKTLMSEAGVPVVPGYQGADQSDPRLAEEAAKIGYPVLIKAVAGGGGKGMRRVDTVAEFREALRRARSEALSAFGNQDVLVEKLIAHPRHIEVQIFGDGKRVAHLFERDCSLQRRHQKVIEEAPAPGMTDAMRAAVCNAAVRAGEAIGYRGAGTVEFIADATHGLQPDAFWFMEMNTRLQVEHPVTEAVTGVDLVEWQLRVAAGEALPKCQEDIVLAGHAIEARIYAEDPHHDFLPAPGELRHVSFPGSLRVESGVRSGDVISPFYDPMIAKLIAKGDDRKAALSALIDGLNQTELVGTSTNRSFLVDLLSNDDVARGQVDTGLIARVGGAWLQKAAPDPVDTGLAAIVLADLDGKAAPERGFTLWAPLRVPITVIEEGRTQTVWLTVDGDRIDVECDGHTLAFEWDAGWRVNGIRMEAYVNRLGTDEVIVRTSVPRVFTRLDPLNADIAPDTPLDGIVRAPMPGLVRAILADAGASVAQGDRLAILEAMKMEHALTATEDGVIAEVFVTEGTQVGAGEPLLRVEPAE